MNKNVEVKFPHYVSCISDFRFEPYDSPSKVQVCSLEREPSITVSHII